MTSLMGPADAPFRQQRLPAWQPILSPPYVISCFLLITAIFIPIGGVILSASSSVVEHIVPYDSVPVADPALCAMINKDNCSCADYYEWRFRKENVHFTGDKMECKHKVEFTVSTEIPKPVYMYYRLENYHQNHRRFAKSRFDPQLAGMEVQESEMNSDCDPFQKQNGTIINPCGLIAWAMFNDSFKLFETTNNGEELLCDTSVPSARQCDLKAPFYKYYEPACKNLPSNKCTKDGIAWASDVDTKFSQTAEYAAKYLSFPNEYANESLHKIPDVNDEDLMVWMRTAAMPTFRKLLRKIEVPLKPGVTYHVDIIERYPVHSFGGTKALVFANTAWIGGRSELLGSAYLVVGAVCAILAAGFLLKHVLSPRDPGDLAFFQNQRG